MIGILLFVLIVILLFVLSVACIYGSGRLTKASGRSPWVGYLLALFLGGILRALH